MFTNVIKKIKEMSFVGKQPAFTLAEVLIALVVLGVIASTVTGVVYFSRKDMNNKDLVATLQSQVIKLNRSYKIALAENDDLDRWVYKNASDNSVEKMSTVTQAKKNELFAKVWESYFPTTKVCGASTSDSCFPKSTASGQSSVNYNSKSDYYKLRTGDGAAVAIKISDHLCRGTGVNGKDKGVCGEIIIDINGNKGPNKEGLDTYRLGIYHNGIRPFAAGCDNPLNSANVVLTSGETCYEDFNVITCPKDSPHKCHNCDGKIVCVANETACSALQKSGGCAQETCPEGTISYYADGKIQCIPEAQKECYEQIKLNPEYKWDPVTKKCLTPKENCEKNGGYWEDGKEICWDSPEHMCTTKQQVYVPKPNQNPNFECITQEEYCKREVRKDGTGGLGGWLWKNNVCCTATSVASNTNATCCNSYSDIKGGSHTWWDGTSACCTSNNTEACCKSVEDGHEAGFWSNGKCWKDPKTQCENPAPAGLGGIWIASTNSCCTTKIVDNKDNPKYCFASEKDKCNAPADKGGKGGWYVASADKCCTSETDAQVCCKGIWRSYSGKNYCYENEKAVCVAPTSQAGIGGWWVPEATSGYNTYSGCCTSSSSRACCNGIDKNHWWAASTVTCCAGPIEASKSCCESAENGHESKYWTSAPSQCWTSASQFCITPTGSNGLGGWNWIGDAKSGVCCTDTSKATRSNDNGNGNIQHQGQFDRLLTDDYSKRCCINESTLNGHSRFIWYTANYKGNTGYCWDNVNNLCQQQTDSSDDHGLGGWYWDGTDCCSINTKPASISYWTKGNIKSNPPTLESTGNVSVKNESDRSTKSCCTNSNGKGGHTRFNWTDKNYAGKGGYCWFDDEELCQNQTDSGSDFGMGGWYWDKASNHCCSSKYDVNVNTNNKTQEVFRKGASSAQVKVYNQRNDSNLNCCTNANTKGGHTRFIWTAKTYADTRGYCWLNNDELCQEQTDNSNYNHDAGMGGWLWDSASNSCCTIRTTSAQPINIKGGSASSVAVKNQSSNSNKNCCTNPSKKGGHTRFNWTNNNYAGKGGYCWLDDAELCQAQTGLADYGMGGWYWDSANGVCCTIKYDTSTTTAPKTQEVFRSGGFAAQVKVANQQNASNKNCCTNGNSKGGHTRFNWTDNNYAGKGGYCWLDQNEICQSQTDSGNDHGMGGWYYDSSTQTCCTITYNTGAESEPDTQIYFGKNNADHETEIFVKNETNSSSKACCTNSNTKGGHSRFNWTDNNYASKGGYCWDNDAELCQSQTGTSKDRGMGGWLWDSASNSCCTINTTSAQTKYVKGGSSASVAVKNQSSNSNKNCCTSTQSKGGHTRYNWTDNNYAGKGGYCWLDDAELCQAQTGLADYGMGGWAWDSSASTCCTIKTTSAQTKYVKGGSSAKVNVKNQSDSSSKFCCTNNNSKGGHTRYNWTDDNYAGKGGYCWLDQNEICQGQTDSSNDHGMGGWYYDSSTQTCCTVTYNTGAESEPDTQIYFGKNNADHETEVFVKNETNSSSKTCCTNSNTKGGHSRFNWTDNNYAGNGGYCWGDDAELCQNQTGTSKDRGMGGWAWDSSASTCCTIKTTSAQAKYVKGGSSAKVNVKNQSSSSSKFCCTNANTKGGHDRFIWTDNNYASKGGYCWKDNAEVCQGQTGLADYGMGGWLWDSTNSVCCTVKTTSAQKIYTKGGTASTIAVKNQSNDSTRQCCTSTETKGGHKNTLWSSTTSKDNSGYCWLDKAEFCKATISAGLKGWDYDATNDQCCTDNTTTDSSYWNGSKYTKLGKKDQAGSSSEYCCTSTSTDGGHTNFNWINGKCWESNSGFCTDTIENKGAGGWYQDGSNCCTTSKTGTETVKGKGGTTSTITYKNNTDNSTAECCRLRGDNKRAYWLNSYCWNTLDEYCTSTNGKGASGYYSYEIGSIKYCCTGAKTGTLSGKYNGNNYTVTYSGHVAGEKTTKDCCVYAKSGAKTYINDRCWTDLDNYCTTASSSGGAGGYHQYGSTCCVAGKTATSVSVAGGSSATATSTLYIKNENSTKTCCHNKAGTNWYSTSSETSGTCCSEESSKACCESSQNGHTAGVWAASTNTCCHSAEASEACCQAYKGSSAFLAGGTCCASESDSAACCKGFCNNGDAYTYNATTKQCTCVSCENDEYIPKDSSGNVLEAKCCSSADDDSTCCTASNAPGNTAGNFYYATSMCCADANDSAECCSAKYPTKSTAYYNSKCYNFATTQWLLCAEYDTSKISTVTIFGNTTLANKGCSTLSFNVPVTITSKTVSPNKFGSATVTGAGCTYTAGTAADVYSSSGTVSFTQGTTGNNMCLFTPTTGSCDGWWASDTSTLCCTEQNRSECCVSTNNPDGVGTFVSSPVTCCHDAIVSDTCCKAMNNDNYYLAGSTCCASETSKSECCTSTSNPKGRGYWSSSAKTCCHTGDETKSDACCKAIKGSSYTLYGTTCSTDDPNACKAGEWEASDGSCCSEENKEKCCTAETNPNGKGWWINTSATTAYNYDPNLELIAINIPNAYRYKGRVLNYTPAPLFVQPAYAAIQDPMNDANMNRGDDNGSGSYSMSFKFSISSTTGFYNFTTNSTCGSVSSPNTSLSCNIAKDNSYAVTLRCNEGYTPSLTVASTSLGGCTLSTNTTNSYHLDATLTTSTTGTKCNLTGTCTKSSSSGSGSSDSGSSTSGSGSDSGSGTGSGTDSGTGSGSSTSGSYTCCHDEQLSEACCLGKTDNNYWYNNKCTTVNSGVDIIVEYGSDISSVKVGGTSVSNNGKKTVTSANGTTIVATPASGKTFSKWTSTNCTITSSTSGSTTISGVSSGAKYCVIKPTAVTSETPTQPTCDYVISTSSSGDIDIADGVTYYNMFAKKSSSDSASYEDLRDEAISAINSGQLGSSYEYIWAGHGVISNATATLPAHTGVYLYGGPIKTTYIDTGKNVVNKAYIDRDNTDCTVNVERVSGGGLYTAVVVNNKSNCASCKVAIKGCTGWLAAETQTKITCCTSASASQACCESDYTGHTPAIWSSTTSECCVKETQSMGCCKAIKGSNYSLLGGECKDIGANVYQYNYKILSAKNFSKLDLDGCSATASTLTGSCKKGSSSLFNNTFACKNNTRPSIAVSPGTFTSVNYTTSGDVTTATGKISLGDSYSTTVEMDCLPCQNTTFKFISDTPDAIDYVEYAGTQGTLSICDAGCSAESGSASVLFACKDGYTPAVRFPSDADFEETYSDDLVLEGALYMTPGCDKGTYEFRLNCDSNCDGWETSSGACCTEPNTSACCEAESNPDGAGTWASSTNTCCYSETASDACCKAIKKDSNYSLSGGSCTKAKTCTYDGSYATFNKGTLVTSSGVIVDVTLNGSSIVNGQAYSGNGTLVYSRTLAGAEGTFVPKFRGDCCSLDACTVTGEGVVSCQAKWGSGTCTVAISDCENGFPAGSGNGECCLYDEQSQACCEADSVDSSTGFASHTKGLWNENNNTCGQPESVYLNLNSCIANGTGASEVRIYNNAGTEEMLSAYTETCGENGIGIDTGSYVIKPIMTGADTSKLGSAYFHTKGSCNIKGSTNVKATDCTSGCTLEVTGKCTVWVTDSSSFSTCSACGPSENEWGNGEISVKASNSPVGLSDSTIYVYDSDGAQVLKAENGTDKTASNLDYPAEYTLKHVGTNTSMSNNWVLYSTAAPSTTVSYGYCTLSSGFNGDISSDYTTRTGTISMNGTTSSQNKCRINFSFYCATGKADCTASSGDSCPDGSGTLKLSSSAPSGCTFTYESSGSRAITTSGITVSGGNIKVDCSGYYAPTISGSCCSFTGCNAGTTSNCGIKIGEGSTCTISAEACSTGWIGKNGGCCYSDNSQNCCEADTQSSSGASHTKGTYASGTCCTSATQSEACCKAIKGSSYSYNASTKKCLSGSIGDLDTSGSGPKTTVSFTMVDSSATVNIMSTSLSSNFSTVDSTTPSFVVQPDSSGTITLTGSGVTITSLDKTNCTGLTENSKTGVSTSSVTLNVKGTCTSNFGCSCTYKVYTRESNNFGF